MASATDFPAQLGPGASIGEPLSGTAAALATALTEPQRALAVHYALRDDLGASMDGLKVVDRPGGGYLGVYHCWERGAFRARLARSDDLVRWTRVREFASHASQPTIAFGPSGQAVVAWETDGRGGNHVSIRQFDSVQELEHGRARESYEAPHPLGRYEGTPNIYSVTEDARGRTELRLGLHFYTAAGVDRQAQVLLTDFGAWHPQELRDTNDFFTRAGTNGNLGDRDTVVIGDHAYSVIEAQQVKGDFGTWRIALVDHDQQRVTWLPVATAGGSASLGNPTISMITLPDGSPGFVATNFVFAERSAPGEAGTMLSCFRLDDAASLSRRRAGVPRGSRPHPSDDTPRDVPAAARPPAT